MKLEKRFAEQLLDEDDALDENEVLVYQFIESSDWRQGHKYQFIDIVFRDPLVDKYYQFSTSRSGSPFTDWHYEMEYESEFLDCPEVKKVEKVITTWKVVK